MKKISYCVAYSLRILLFLVVILLLAGSSYAQQELQIHQINVENGDATMIGVYDRGTGKYTSKVLIDGGMSKPSDRLLPYLQKIAADAHFNYIILTHYHTDHYTGVGALGTGQLKADSLVDPGGYDFHQYFPGQPFLTQDHEVKPGSMVVAPVWTDMITKAMTGHYLKGRSQVLISFGNTAQSGLGHKLMIGKLGAFPVTLECVAGWGNTLNGTGVTGDPLPAKNNANNFSLAFVLRCGEFRYFIGGDLGGTNGDLYIDQEDALTGYLVKNLPAAHKISGAIMPGGHVCGFKADHHGSNNANEPGFLKVLSPTIFMTSAGNEASWMLPKEAYLAEIAGLQPVSATRGFYFTNLYNWHTGDQPLTKATSLFAGKTGISFDYGNPTGHVYSYIIRVTPDHLATESDFEVDRVDISQSNPYTRLSSFQCHKK